MFPSGGPYHVLQWHNEALGLNLIVAASAEQCAAMLKRKLDRGIDAKPVRYWHSAERLAFDEDRLRRAVAAYDFRSKVLDFAYEIECRLVHSRLEGIDRSLVEVCPHLDFENDFSDSGVSADHLVDCDYCAKGQPVKLKDPEAWYRNAQAKGLIK